MQTDSEADVRLKVETKLGMEPGTIKREKQYKAAFKDTVKMYLGDATGVSSVIKAYEVLLFSLRECLSGLAVWLNMWSLCSRLWLGRSL